MENEGEKKTFITNYFLELFRSTGASDEGQTQLVLAAVQPRVTNVMNEILLANFNEEEVKKTLNSIDDLKAPGPDGLLTIFFKEYWDVVGGKLTSEVGEKIPEGWNETVIALIPKVEKPEKVTDLRPISLCNVVYKVISKVMSSRLRVILPDIITPNQSAFVPGRLISDNILIAYEITHYLLNKKEGDLGY